MKRVHFLFLGLGLSLCLAAVSPSGGGGTVIPGGATNVALLNGTNVFTGTNRFNATTVFGSNVSFGGDNVYDIGTSGSRARNLYAATHYGNAFVGTTAFEVGATGFFYWDTRSILTAPADGVVRLTDNAQADFNRLQFGGTSASFPSLKRSGTELQVRLADDSGYGNFAMRTLSTPSGANSRAGNVTLVAGTVDVACNTVTANSIVMLTRKTSGGTIGMAITYTLNAGTGFTINSDNVLDASVFSYFVIENP